MAGALHAELTLRRPREVRELLTQVRSDNTASMAMLRRLGTADITADSPGVLQVRVQLVPAPIYGVPTTR